MGIRTITGLLACAFLGWLAITHPVGVAHQVRGAGVFLIHAVAQLSSYFRNIR